MKMNEIEKFKSQFDEEVLTIQLLTDASGFGGGKIGKEKYWTHSIGVTAYKMLDSDEIAIPQGSTLYAKDTNENLAKFRGQIKSDSIITAMVRQKPDKSDFLLVDLVHAPPVPELQELQKKQTAEITYTDKKLGIFTLNRRVGWYETTIDWLGSEVDISINTTHEDELKAALPLAREMVANAADWDKKIKDYAAAELLDLKNDNWQDDCEYPEDDEDAEPIYPADLTAEDFVARLEFESIGITPHHDEYEIFIDDGDLFFGHVIIVSGSFEGGPDGAEIAG